MSFKDCRAAGKERKGKYVIYKTMKNCCPWDGDVNFDGGICFC
jgi:hypothetical protein